MLTQNRQSQQIHETGFDNVVNKKSLSSRLEVEIQAIFILECPDHGKESSASGSVGPGVAAGPSGLNIKQTHHDQGIQLLRIQ